MKNSLLNISLLSFITGFLFIMLSVYTGLSLEGYKSPLTHNYNEVLEHGIPLSEKVVLVVVDGLRYDVSMNMDYLKKLRENGADFISWTEIPSLSYPGWTAILSGAKPEISGVLLNWGNKEVHIENIFSVTKEMHLQNAVVGTPEWWYLFGNNITGGEKIEPTSDCILSDTHVKNSALRLVRSQSNFTLIHFLSVDFAGHAHGGNSIQYLERAREIDGYIKEIAKELDWNTTTLIVTSDHGHLDRGGHGGEETLARKAFAVFYGKGIRKMKGEIHQIDICPTISNILGIKIPAAAQGRIIFECLDQSPQNEAIYSYLLMKQRYLFCKSYFTSVKSNIELNNSYVSEAYAAILSGNTTYAKEISEKGLKEYDRQIEVVHASIEIDQKLNVSAIMLLLFIFVPWCVCILFRKAKISVSSLLKSGVFAGLLVLMYSFIFFLIGLDFSFSVFNEATDVSKTMIISFFVPGILVASFITLYGYLKLKKTPGDVFSIEKEGTAIYGILLSAFVTYIGINAILYGFVFTYFLTNLRAFMRVFLGGFISAGMLMYLAIGLQILEAIRGYMKK
ncbi:MAG: alkaline phosphatase family protein [Thermoplasmata archaeon]